MNKVIGTVLLAGLLIGLLIWSTPVTRLGPGFLIGNARFVITYYDLVKDAENIQVKFPNEDDIPAKWIYKGKTDNVVILELLEPPKVKREPLSIQADHTLLKESYVFSLGYPWTNTLEDRHTFLEGSLASLEENASGFLEIHMDVDPIHSGSPLFNGNREVVGMVISAKTLYDRGDYSEKLNLAIPAAVLIDVMKTNKIFVNANSAPTLKNLPMEEFIEATRNNVVLIEAR
jgi:S1-C subfamily serine protease